MSYGVKVITPSATLPIALADAKLYLKIDSDTTEDALVTSMIRTAQEIVENYCRTRLFTTVEELYLDQFPFQYNIQLEKWPISAVAYVKYYDTNGVEQTVSPSTYILDGVSKPGRICLNYANYWPVVRWIDNAVWVRYSVGFGTTTTDIPAGLISAMYLIIGHLYQNRSDVLINTHVEQLPHGAYDLMNKYRYIRK